MKQRLLKQQILAWYYNHIKYRKYTPQQRKSLATFEFGVRARVEVHTLIPTLMRQNIERVCALYDDDFARVELLDTQISSMQSDFDASVKELDAMDKTLWRLVFMEFISTHDDETCYKVWGVPKGELEKLRGFVASHKSDTKT